MQEAIKSHRGYHLATVIHYNLNPLVQTCHRLSKRGAVLADPAIAATHGEQIATLLGYELLPTTGKKDRRAKELLEDALFAKHFGRDSLFVALGGGTTTDLVGFTASTYMRGVPFVSIPTTLLAMVDAAIGGKTGLDLPYGKNLIGAFYLPKAIFIDPSFLNTLSQAEMRNGLSEILKYGLIDNPCLFQPPKDLLPAIEASIQCKLKVVEQDFGETGYRRILNFGHTVGHALEIVQGISHGEAVALGCMAESYLSHRLGYLSKALLENILSLYQSLGYSFKRVDRALFLQALMKDKKGKGGLPRCVLIDAIGHCVPFDGEYCREIPSEEWNGLIDWINDARNSDLRSYSNA